MVKMIVETNKRNVYKYFFPIYKMLKERRESFTFAFAIFLTVLLLIPLTDASFLDWLTGKATSGSHTVSITMGNSACNITNMTFFTTALTPVQGTNATLNFSFLVYDPDGVSNVDTTYAVANLSITGNQTQTNSSCSYIGTAGTSANFSCIIPMNYFLTDGTWTVTVQVRDISLQYCDNKTNTFTYNLLTSYDFGVSAITFTGVTAGSSNKTAAQNYTVNNSGNDQVKFLSINASYLYNSTNLATGSPYNLAAENFTVDIEYGAALPQCDVGGSAFSMKNVTYVNVTGSNVYRGQTSYNNGTGQRWLYYCLNNVSSALPSGTYDTSKLGPWYVKVVS